MPIAVLRCLGRGCDVHAAISFRGISFVKIYRFADRLAEKCLSGIPFLVMVHQPPGGPWGSGLKGATS